ncbi:hypothetical protein N476_19015 [Pseudoalteromonas luteoviolacea H33]|uniref:Uncharacterized protein n=1 Tax=Pseudoalteromonas luteoviolacea H33 TaxID=1365251 RepID=A0A167DUK3_9GAMM|nr:hypothetical protein N476_19015 [Pseudoalteromonas luteoviolacea H33]KZN72687.1 hypothetical protein N477_25165 [Pseudoalteromonas luteoviolacea H33-S]
MVYAFATGVLLTCGFYEIRHTDLGAQDAPSEKVLHLNEATRVMAEEHILKQAIPPVPPRETHSNALPVLNHTTELEQLVQRNQQLEQENSRLKAQLLHPSESSPSSYNVPNQLKNIFAHQRRDEVWASEVELFAEDFLYEASLHDDVEMLSVECRQHICQLNFASQSNSTSPRWQQLHNALLNMPWMKQFKTVTAVQNQGVMQIHLSLKTSEQLKSEY